MRLLLDTCTYLWFISGSKRLPTELGDKLRNPANEVLLSVVSVWEASVKHQLGRLDLPEPPGAYLPRQRARHHIGALALEETAVAHLGNLPMLHRDPFDRMLVCQAIEHDLTIASPDPAIQSYPVKVVWG